MFPLFPPMFVKRTMPPFNVFTEDWRGSEKANKCKSKSENPLTAAPQICTSTNIDRGRKSVFSRGQAFNLLVDWYSHVRSQPGRSNFLICLTFIHSAHLIPCWKMRRYTFNILYIFTISQEVTPSPLRVNTAIYRGNPAEAAFTRWLPPFPLPLKGSPPISNLKAKR